VVYRLKWHPRGVEKVFSGHVKFGQIVASESEIEGDERFADLRYVLIDFSQVASLMMSNFEHDHIVAMRIGAASTNPGIKYAYVCDTDKWQQVLTHQQNKSRSRFLVRGFQTRSEAMQWLFE